MKLKILLIVSICLLSIPLIHAHDYNFTDIYNITDWSTAIVQDRLNVFNKNTTTWFVQYQEGKASTDNMHYLLLDQNFNEMVDTQDSPCSYNVWENSDCKLVVSTNGDYVYECVGHSTKPASTYNNVITNFSLETLATTCVNETATTDPMTDPIQAIQKQSTPSVKPIKLWDKATENDFRYTITDDLNSVNGDGEINIPASYENPSDSQVVYCGNNYHVIIKPDSLGSELVDLIYDNDLQFIYAHTIALGSLNYAVADRDYGVWVEGDYTLHLVISNRTRILFTEWTCEPSNIVQVYSREYSIPDIIRLDNSAVDIIRKPFATKDIYGTYVLGFELYNTTHSRFELAVDQTDCTCSDWIAQNNCSNEYQKYTRTCAYNCDTNTTYWAITNYCDIKYNQTLGIYTQEYTKFATYGFCRSELVSVGEIAECTIEPFDVPMGCTEINTTLNVLPTFATNDFVIGCSSGNYRLTACNPSYDCDDNLYSCSEYNHTLNNTYDSYSAGDTITAKVQLYVDTSCLCQIGWNPISLYSYGIKKYSVAGSLYLECSKPCEQEWFCLDENNKGLRRIDCSVTNQTGCEYGCSDGVCVGSGEGDSSTSSPDFWYNFFLQPEKPVNKFFIAIIGTMFIGSFGLYFGKNPIYFMIMFGCGWALFTLMGYIPAILTLFIVFFTGLYFYFKNSKGG